MRKEVIINVKITFFYSYENITHSPFQYGNKNLYK